MMGNETSDSGATVPQPPAMPLMMVSEGQEATLAEIRGGRRVVLRLAELGLTPGVQFRMISQGHPGPCIICVKDSRLVLGRGMAHRVFVVPQ